MRVVVLSAFLLGGCGTLPLAEPRSIGEVNASYNYIPLDPLDVQVVDRLNCATGPGKQKTLLDFLPDNAVRVAVERLSGEGSITVGPAVIGSGGNRYRVTLDYINASTANVRFAVGTYDDENRLRGLDEAPLSGNRLYIRRLRENAVGSEEEAFGSLHPDDANQIVVPVYVGVGLRLTALIDVRKGKVNLASLGAIAASVEAERAYGSLTVQTLGINGPQVAASLPLPSELNTTTVQNAVQSLGAIKAIIYDGSTRLAPRVTGIYNPLPDNSPRVINAIVSQLAERPIPWNLSCPLSPRQAIVANPDATPVP